MLCKYYVGNLAVLNKSLNFAIIKNMKELLSKFEQQNIYGGKWVFINGKWVYFPDDEEESDNEVINN